MLNERSLLRLESVHPRLAAMVMYVEREHPIFQVSEGLRSAERQEQLYATGKSRTMESLHLRQSSGYAHAVDVVATGDLNHDGRIDDRDKRYTWDPKIYRQIADWMFFAAEIWRAYIRWGGNFRNFFDGPHFELRSWSSLRDVASQEPFAHASGKAIPGDERAKK